LKIFISARFSISATIFSKAFAPFCLP